MPASVRPTSLPRLLGALAIAAALAVSSGAQTRITAPKNNYSLDDDVKLGQDAAKEVVKEMPLLNDERVDDYVETVGATLSAAIPPEFQHPQFHYTFDVVNQKEINAFALPGGPMFINRGTIEAAKTEGEVAGVMAHELSHVALRHGTAQATKGQKFQLGSLFGQALGALLGGTAGSVVSQGTQLTLGGIFLKYSREFESQADLLGAQILARAGYDPREMANMFKTIEAEGGSRGPQWLSSHPNPGNRFEAINREAALLHTRGNTNTGQLESIQARLRGMPPAYTAEQIAKGEARSGAQPAGASRNAAARVAPPASQYRSSSPFSFLRLSVPTNWMEVGGNDTGVTYAPEGGYREAAGDVQGFSHGFQIGIGPRSSGNLQRDTEQLVAALARSNPELRRQGGYSRETVGGRAGLRTTLSNQSDFTGQPETISLTTALLADGRLLFLVGVAPQREASLYADAFRRIRQSVRLRDR